MSINNDSIKNNFDVFRTEALSMLPDCTLKEVSDLVLEETKKILKVEAVMWHLSTQKMETV
ncbi:hypothetical protein [Methanobacterium petrolearium]|uniref:hypothetical protein n=1 Tax=Methanobacterium petrolearium TaxID=710190 RepID=UPI0030818D6C|nr:hypothetical protein GCM10025861_06070 [Methanobacterium petrolearium]